METPQTSLSTIAPHGVDATSPSTDWAAIEHVYCTTKQSARDIGRDHGISHTAINKRAKAAGWKRPELVAETGKRTVSDFTAPDESASAPARVTAAALEPRQQRFVDEYLIDLNGTQAAIRAGYSANSAAEQAYDLLRKPQIKASIAASQKRLQDKLEIKAESVVRQLALIATADPRELIEVRVGCCRCCHGTGHRSQRTELEMANDRQRWATAGKPANEFDEQGGTGYTPHLLPHPECPSCGGDGEPRTVLKDTRHLSPQAAALYAGAKQTKYGVEIQMHSQLEAWEKLAKNLGLYAKDNYQRSDPLSLRNMSDAERAMRMQRVLAANPELQATLGQMLGEGAAE